jgi:deoxyribodipyrimidine photolyase-related protein
MNLGQSVRLVLPHQLFEKHLDASRGTTFVLIEHDLLFRQYRFHAHKLVLHRASMASFARRLRDHGYEVVVLSNDASHSSRDLLAELVRTRQPEKVTVFDVVDDWLEKDLVAALAEGGYRLRPDDVLETPNFLTNRTQIDDWFSHNPSRMQEFYIWQRRRLNLLLTENGGPLGGKWSFDTENRKKLPRGYVPPTVGLFARHPVLQKEGTFDLDALMQPDHEPSEADAAASRDIDEAIAWVASEFPDAPGDPHRWMMRGGISRSLPPNDCAISGRTKTPSRPSIPLSTTACSPRR